MAAFSSYLQNKVIDHMLRNQSFTPPTTVYLALFTASTGLSSNNPSAEVSTSGTAYARQTIALDAAASGATANTSQILFPEATAGYGSQVTHFAIVDHPTNTTWGTNVNVLAYGALATAKTVDAGDIMRVDAGDLDISIA